MSSPYRDADHEAKTFWEKVYFKCLDGAHTTNRAGEIADLALQEWRKRFRPEAE